MSQIDLSSKTILLLGASGLLGGAILRNLFAAKATVILASRNATINNVLEGDSGTTHNESFHRRNVDLADSKSLTELFTFIEDEFTSLDGVVFNSVSRPMKSLEDDEDLWDQSMKVNSRGLFVVMRQAIRLMKKQQSGSIVSVASIQGMLGCQPELYEGLGMDTSPDYFFHKAGLINFTRYLASLAGVHGIRVNCVSPGGIYNSAIPQDPVFLQRYSQSTMLGRLANPDEVACAILFLLSNLSTYITGTNLVVDGGYTAK